MSKIKYKSDGFTLLEVMIAMVLNIILLFGALQTIILVKNIWEYQQGLNRLQENASILYLLFDEILKTAGGLSCNKIDQVQFKELSPLINDRAMGLFNAPIQKVQIKELQSNPYISQSFFQRIKPDSDILWVISSKVPNHLNNTLNRVLMVDDCLRMIAFINQNNMTVEQIQVPFKYTHFRLLQSKLYYVGKTKRQNNNQPVYALYSTDLNGTTQELVEGVESIKVTADWSNLNNIKIDFILNSVFATGLRKKWTMEWPFQR